MAAKAAQRRKAAPPRRRGRWVLPLVAVGVLLTAAGVGALVFWDGLEPEEREQVGEVVLDAADSVREAQGVPLEVRRWLDRRFDRIPAHVGPLAPTPGGMSPGEPWYAGAPRAMDGREIRILRNRGHAIGWDVAARAPSWAAYRVVRASGEAPPLRAEGFRMDPRVPDLPGPQVYRGSSFDRGQLVPSTTLGIIHGEEAQHETFLLTNVVPMRPNLNRGAWRILEGRIQGRLALVLDEVWVTVGPLYESVVWRHHLPDGPPVPDAFFVVLVDERRDRRIRALALRIPQSAEPGEAPAAWLTTVGRIEAEAALEFFPDLPAGTRSPLKTHLPARMW